MKKLDKNELTVLGDSFLQLAQAVGEYRIENYKKLSPLMQNRIRTYHKSLIDYADFFYASSTSLIVENAKSSLEKIELVSTEMKETLQKLKNIQNVINIIGAATRLGAAILSKQPSAITSSLKEFLSTFEKLKKKTAKQATI